MNGFEETRAGFLGSCLDREQTATWDVLDSDYRMRYVQENTKVSKAWELE